jgi:hypothetical protein
MKRKVICHFLPGKSFLYNLRVKSRKILVWNDSASFGIVNVLEAVVIYPRFGIWGGNIR